MANGTLNGSVGFEQQLWQAADKLRNNMDAAEYKHVVLGLIFLKYISDAFMEKHKELVDDPEADPEADPELESKIKALEKIINDSNSTDEEIEKAKTELAKLKGE